MNQLLFKNTYKTTKKTVSLFARLFPGFYFYTYMFYRIFISAILAKQGKYNGTEWVSSSLSVFRTLERTGVTIEVDNISAFSNLDTPCIFVANHMSTLETFILPCIIHPIKKMVFIIKESLATYPVFNHIANARDPIVVTRTNPRKDFKTVLEGGRRRLDNGISIVIFPQTTRSSVFDPTRFTTIATKLAKHTGRPIVPIALKTDAWGIGKKIKDFGEIDPSKTVRFHFGEPVYVSGNGKEEHKKIIEFIGGKFNSWSE